MLYSKNGSIPKLEMSGDKEGWVEVPEPPIPPEGKEVVWWDPPGWVVRDPQPVNTDTTIWKWSQTQEQWVEYPIPIPTPEPAPEPAPEPTLESAENTVVLDTLESAASVTDTGTAMGSATEV
jgi:hypothetical protein